jgi:hypothetical protein
MRSLSTYAQILGVTLLLGLLALTLAVYPRRQGGELPKMENRRGDFVVVACTPDNPIPLAPLDVVVVGKVIEIEPNELEVTHANAAPWEPRVTYRVAVVQIDERLLGASGITRLRVGFQANWPQLALKPGMEGCVALTRQSQADFYTQVNCIVEKQDARFPKVLRENRTLRRVTDDPVAALKAMELTDRFDAAKMLLEQYLRPRGSHRREPIPDEENKLILHLLLELPWKPIDGGYDREDGGTVPHRCVLWNMINPSEFGFERPMPVLPRPRELGVDVASNPEPSDPPADPDTLMDRATIKFLKENADKFKLKRFVQK